MACKKALAPAHAQQPLQLPGRIMAALWPPTAGPVTLTHAQCPTSTSSLFFFPPITNTTAMQHHVVGDLAATAHLLAQYSTKHILLF